MTIEKSIVFFLTSFCKIIHKVTNLLICHLNDNTYSVNMSSEKLIKRRLIIMYKFMLNETSYHGAGAIKAVPEEIKARGFKKVFVASDPDLVKFGVTKKVTDLLDEAGIEYVLYSNIKPNPTIENVQTGVAAFKEAGADCIVAIGGGSSMDTSKAIGIIITNPEFADVRSLEGVAPTKNPCAPIIAVPTTAGTAAEVTINYVITDVEKKRKFVCVDNHDIPVVAVVDPEMMSSMPKGLTAATGMDALTHAIEGYITKGAWELSDMFHIKAIEIIARSLRGAVENTAEGREGMALGQYVAGMGFSNVGLGVDHSMAHTLSAYYDMPHGKACAILLPTTMEYNAEYTGEKYKDIAKAMGVEGVDGMTQEEYRKAAVDAVKKLGEDVGIEMTLKGVVKEEDIPQLAKDAYADACRPGNPRDTSVEDIEALYRSLLK
ncbi:lactaldehyde reductase [Catenibacterium mitsuokai DSM 15897]|nr:lactaldehyde reductase [Catenibacterium mitsuokai DSM 15897]